MGKWFELLAQGREETRGLAVSLLIEAGSPATEELSATKVRAFLEEPQAKRLEELIKRLASVGWSIRMRPFEDKDWLFEWRRHIRPVRVKPFYIYQSFSSRKPPEGYIPILIDPSMAFGTGTHPSTKLALKGLAWLFKGACLKERPIGVLDVGTGSGILAIAAKKLGADRVVATDIDELSLKEARKTARENNTPIRVTAKGVDEIRGSFSIVVANIIKETLIALSEGLTRRTQRGGWLLLSGLLKEEAEEVANHFSRLSFRPVRRFSLKEWCSLVMKKG